jgi:DNA-binding transcriptional LysR family regulator
MLYFLPDGLLEAFVAVAETGSISAAAKRLHVTQPALTIRLKKLETHLGSRMFSRGRKGVSLTKEGELLLTYTRSRAALDGEFKEIATGMGGGRLSGVVRIASHFSVNYCGILPCVASLLRKHPELHVELIVREDDEIPAILLEGKCDLALLQKPVGKPGYQAELVGWERYVLAESRNTAVRNTHARSDVILATDPSDDFADQFFAIQAPEKRRSTWSRCYMFNEMGILRGVELGLGQSVIYEPLVRSSSQARVASGYRPLDIPVYLHVHNLSLHSRAVQRVHEHILANKQRFFRQAPDLPHKRQRSRSSKGQAT